MNPIDLDLEAVELDGRWLTREQLASLIKSKLEAGDYNISRQGDALEQLTHTLADLRPITIPLTREAADAVSKAATKQGKTEASIVREALMAHLMRADAPALSLQPTPVMRGARSAPVASTSR
jgi:hypothetical protein